LDSTGSGVISIAGGSDDDTLGDASEDLDNTVEDPNDSSDEAHEPEALDDNPFLALAFATEEDNPSAPIADPADPTANANAATRMADPRDPTAFMCKAATPKFDHETDDWDLHLRRWRNFLLTSGINALHTRDPAQSAADAAAAPQRPHQGVRRRQCRAQEGLLRGRAVGRLDAGGTPDRGHCR
jgi:hypothetical protein